MCSGCGCLRANSPTSSVFIPIAAATRLFTIMTSSSAGFLVAPMSNDMTSNCGPMMVRTQGHCEGKASILDFEGRVGTHLSAKFTSSLGAGSSMREYQCTNKSGKSSDFNLKSIRISRSFLSKKVMRCSCATSAIVQPGPIVRVVRAIVQKK
jgi:hypothetical protein